MPKTDERRRISKARAKRIACAMTGEWLLLTDTDGLPENTPQHIVAAVQVAQAELAKELIRRGKGELP